MIDPFTALAGIQSAVALVKKVSATIDDVSSLGPVLGKYFDAKSTAVKAAVQAKNSGQRSAMAVAIEIEMSLLKAQEFENQLQLLFMQAGKIDIWAKIKARAAAMDAEAAHMIRREKEARMRRRRAFWEAVEIGIVVCLFVTVIAGAGWLGWKIYTA